MDVVEFIYNNITVDRYPIQKEILKGGKYQDVDVIINVSDYFYLMDTDKHSYYFPMGELGSSMGLSSIYGALQVLYNVYSYKPNWKVLLHCQEGLNRSPTILAAFHYMMTGEHISTKIQN